MKEALKNDRARIQVGRISHFGLLEMSRQRIRASVLESTMKTCAHCGGTGHVRSDSSVALHVVRAIEEHLLKDNRHHITVRTPVATALYVLNHKRANIIDLETRFGLSITIEADESVGIQHYAITRGAVVENPVAIPLMPSYTDTTEDEILDAEIVPEAEVEEEAPVAAAQPERREPREQREGASDDGQGRRKRKRRRRRGGRDRDGLETSAQAGEAGEAVSSDHDEDELEQAEIEVEAEAGETIDEAGADADGGKKRRRGKRGGRKNRREADGGEIEAGAEGVGGEADDAQGVETLAEAPASVTPDAPVAEAVEAVAADEPVTETAAEPEAKPEPKKRARRPSKKALAEAEAAAKAAEAAAETPVAAVATAEAAPAVETPAEPAAAQSVEAAVAEPTPAEEAPETARASRRKPSAPLATEPVVTSATKAAEDGEAKPRKAGWWQRKSFF
jgi:ribonuclease E